MPDASTRMTVFAVAMTCGMLLALALQMLSGHIGLAPTTVWKELYPTDMQAVRAALGWWLIAAAGLGGSFVAGLTVRPRPGGGNRLLRWVLAVPLFLLLAAVPLLTPQSHAQPAVALAANLVVFALAMVAAFCGSWFASRSSLQ